MTAPNLLDFGLDGDQEARARRLHDECIIFDGMNQHPGGARIFDELPADWLHDHLGSLGPWEAIGTAGQLPYLAMAEGLSDAIERWWRESGVDVGSLAVSTNLSAGDGEIDASVVTQFDWIELVTTAAQIRKNKANGIISLWGVDQPTMGIPNTLDSVDDAYGRGLRSLMLTYNRMDFVGTGCTERYDAGLSMYGLDVVRRCNELGIIVDTSHCGRRTTLDACEYSSTPVIANHTSAAGLFAHARGKDDDTIRALAATGGMVAMVTVPFFMAKEPRPRLDVVLDHVEYVAGLVGVDHVGLGTDWPMQIPIDVVASTLGEVLPSIGFRPEDNIDVTATFDGFDDYREFVNITRGLVARGWSDEDIAKVLGENFLRVIETVCG